MGCILAHHLIIQLRNRQSHQVKSYYAFVDELTFKLCFACIDHAIGIIMGIRTYMDLIWQSHLNCANLIMQLMVIDRIYGELVIVSINRGLPLSAGRTCDQHKKKE